MKLMIATGNAHKMKEIHRILSGLDLDLLCNNDFPGMPEVEETEVTYAGNAMIKAKAAYQHTGLLSVGDDSGLAVEYLDGAPGVFSARYAGEQKSPLDNNNKLLQELKGVAEKQRGARFYCVVAIVGDGVETVIEGIAPGKILETPRGAVGFGYDPLFVPDGHVQSYAEMDSAVKNRISHRARAFSKVRDFIVKLSVTR